MINHRNSEVHALIVSGYELVQSGLKALLLKVNKPLITSITEYATTVEAIKAYQESPFQLVLLDESIIIQEGLEQAMELIKQMRASVVLCFLFRQDETVVQAIAKAGVTGYFHRTIMPGDFARDVERLLEGDLLKIKGVVLCNQML